MIQYTRGKFCQASSFDKSVILGIMVRKSVNQKEEKHHVYSNRCG